MQPEAQKFLNKQPQSQCWCVPARKGKTKNFVQSGCSVSLSQENLDTRHAADEKRKSFRRRWVLRCGVSNVLPKMTTHTAAISGASCTSWGKTDQQELFVLLLGVSVLWRIFLKLRNVSKSNSYCNGKWKMRDNSGIPLLRIKLSA